MLGFCFGAVLAAGLVALASSAFDLSMNVQSLTLVMPIPGAAGAGALAWATPGR